MYRRYYSRRAAKYSNETMAFNVKIQEPKEAGSVLTDNPLIVVPATDVLGNRKVKNFTIRFTSYFCNDPVFGVLAYVPEGTDLNRPLVTGPTQSLYEPNQNVIATFIIPASCTRDGDGDVQQANSQTVVVSTKLARNLNTGDKISLALCTPNGIIAGDGQEANPPPAFISGTINYSIKY